MTCSKPKTLPGIFVAPADHELGGTLDVMDKVFRDYTARAARGECSWVCADCCVTFPDGMPDECLHGHQSCTDIIIRDKADSKNQAASQEGAKA